MTDVKRRSIPFAVFAGILTSSSAEAAGTDLPHHTRRGARGALVDSHWESTRHHLSRSAGSLDSWLIAFEGVGGV